MTDPAELHTCTCGMFHSLVERPTVDPLREAIDAACDNHLGRMASSEPFTADGYRWQGIAAFNILRAVIGKPTIPQPASPAAPSVDPLREAAQAVVNGAEPDDNFDGEFIEYLVSFEAIDALRAALAS